jgi:hypothetical protein
MLVGGTLYWMVVPEGIVMVWGRWFWATWGADDWLDGAAMIGCP